MQYLIEYYCQSCSLTWHDIWDCACNGECPKCETSDIEPVSWEELPNGEGAD